MYCSHIPFFLLLWRLNLAFLFCTTTPWSPCCSSGEYQPSWSVWRLCLVVVWRWNYTGCCWLAVWTALGCICHLVGTFIPSAFSVPSVRFPQEWMGLEPSCFGLLLQHPTHGNTLCHLEIENWDYTARAAVMLVQKHSAVKPYLCQDVNPDVSLLQWEMGSCYKEVQHGLVSMRNRQYAHWRHVEFEKKSFLYSSDFFRRAAFTLYTLDGLSFVEN